MSQDEKKCSICGQTADFIVKLKTVGETKTTMPFYLCKEHESYYEKMKDVIDIHTLFPDTIEKLR